MTKERVATLTASIGAGLLFGTAGPLSIAILQILFLGFLPPTALLLLDAGVLVVAGQLGRTYQPLPTSRHNQTL